MFALKAPIRLTPSMQDGTKRTTDTNREEPQWVLPGFYRPSIRGESRTGEPEKHRRDPATHAAKNTSGLF